MGIEMTDLDGSPKTRTTRIYLALLLNDTN